MHWSKSIHFNPNCMGTITPTMRVKQIKLDYKPNTMRVKKFSKSVSSIQFKIELFRFPSN